MAHYFDAQNTKSSSGVFILYYDKIHPIKFHTDFGVFSKSGVDYGSDMLVKEFLKSNPQNLKCLDLGCGIGPVGIISNYMSKTLTFDYVDVNERAVKLTQKNLQENGLTGDVILSNCCDEIMNRRYDIVLLNPPIRAGKQIIFKMFAQSHQILNKGGKLIVVLRYKQGAKTTINKITEIFGNNNILEKDKGYVVCEFVKN